MTLSVLLLLLLLLPPPICAQRYRPKFDFLPLSSRSIWGIHLHGPPNSSYNEWNPSAPLCSDIYTSYLSALDARDPHIGDYIYNVSDCILNSCSALQAQTIQASNVLLGLAPILLSTTGPSLIELALISIQRPLLAVVLSLGTAAVGQSRVLSFYDDLPRDVLGRHSLRFQYRPSPSIAARALDGILHSDRPGRMGSRMAHVLLGGVEYLIAAAAAGNILYTSWQLGTSTIFLLDCAQSWFPLLWTCLPLLVHALVCGAFHVHLNAVQKSKRPRLDNGQGSTGGQAEGVDGGALDGQDIPLSSLPTNQAIQPTLDDSNNPQDSEQPQNSPESTSQASFTTAATSRSAHGWKATAFERHLVPTCAHDEVSAEFLDKLPFAVDAAHKLGTMLAFAQVIYGVIIFSSLLFISAADACAILLRYLASVLACRVLIALELGSVRAEKRVAGNPIRE